MTDLAAQWIPRRRDTAVCTSITCRRGTVLFRKVRGDGRCAYVPFVDGCARVGAVPSA